MKVWFIQGFTKEIEIYCGVNASTGNITLKNFTVSDDTAIEKLDKRLITDFSKGAPITEVTLRGQTRALKDIEIYYNNKEGVNVKWL